ncbi:TetR/AcrR family transcriptional regulator [Chryseosolibacter indicus]|uniref:TetR/AcrR family transcriptional regulator n=1 Tax=Chryseosolibacter indicus TaxID=2782351 RepID=A0ABS5VY08_9BACT|nr:TetR/AcrR family transcriptional regulator [Chryseosolibacter indicus]MBT1705755.1 TetR/AcrR family transcriptional regulator [Chryseosolibacter indicus]
MTKSEKTREFIIQQSASIINKKGIAGTAISDLMEATGLAKGGIYGNFESKEEICSEVFDYLTRKVGVGLEAAIATKTTAREKLFALLDYYADGVGPSEMGGCPLLNFGIEADDTNPALKQRVAKAIKRSQQRMAKLIEEGQASGEFNKKIDAGLFALKMFTMIEGAIFSSRVTNNRTIMKTITDILKNEIDSF